MLEKGTWWGLKDEKQNPRLELIQFLVKWYENYSTGCRYKVNKHANWCQYQIIIFYKIFNTDENSLMPWGKTLLFIKIVFSFLCSFFVLKLIEIIFRNWLNLHRNQLCEMKCFYFYSLPFAWTFFSINTACDLICKKFYQEPCTLLMQYHSQLILKLTFWFYWFLLR